MTDTTQKLALYRDASIQTLAKHIEGLISATYLVTGLFSDDEPLKWKLRKHAVELLSDIVVLEKEYVSSSDVKKILSKVDDVVSLFTVAHLGKLISTMNNDILVREYSRIKEHIERHIQAGKVFDDIRIEELFKSQVDRFSEEVQATHRVGDHDSAIKNTQDTNSVSLEKKEKNKEAFSNRHTMSKRMSLKKNISNGTAHERKQRILAIVQKKKEVTLTDIAQEVKGYSEKTLQRDLLALVKKGVLKKKGERRWRTYSLR